MPVIKSKFNVPIAIVWTFIINRVKWRTNQEHDPGRALLIDIDIANVGKSAFIKANRPQLYDHKPSATCSLIGNVLLRLHVYCIQWYNFIRSDTHLENK